MVIFVKKWKIRKKYRAQIETCMVQFLMVHPVHAYFRLCVLKDQQVRQFDFRYVHCELPPASCESIWCAKANSAPTLEPRSHRRHGRDKTVLSCQRGEQNSTLDKTVSKFGDRNFRNCFVQSRIICSNRRQDKTTDSLVLSVSIVWSRY